MPKFRSMSLETPEVATHLLENPELHTSSFGSFLRKTSLDELPQIFSVLKGDMSLVGPRPCLLNQKTLIKERKKRGIFKVKPGITGLAQISGINMKTPTLLAKTDLKMLKKMSLVYYFCILLKTLLVVLIKK